MGTKIKPLYKSDFPLISEGWHLFRITEARIDAIAKEDQKEKDGIINDKNFVVRCAVEGGEDNGIENQINFQSHSKKEFGLSLLYGLMVKTESISSTDELDSDSMRTEKFESVFKMKLPKRMFGGRVKHTTSKQKDSEQVFSNISEFLTVKEYNEKIAEISQGEGKGKGKGKDTPKTGNGKPEGGEKDDPWKGIG